MPDVPTSNSRLPNHWEFASPSGSKTASETTPVALESANSGPPSGSGNWQQLSWQKQLSRCLRTSKQLMQRLNLDLPQACENTFPVMVPESFLARMNHADPHDPLLRQVLATDREANSVDGFVPDPVGDSAARKAEGLLQKYHGRALLITTGSCAVHCRYCFRRNYPYQSEPKTMVDWQPALHQIAADQSITEVILSGGDPLLLTDARLLQLVHAIDGIDHIKRIRFHTRLPIVLPARITTELMASLQQLKSQVIWVVHSNHAQEIQFDCKDTLAKMVQSGFPVLNQAVLLKDVNDNLPALKELSEVLVNIGVMPYYLHQLDRVTGAAHFETSVDQGRQLVEQLRTVLPGYAVPQFVQEIEGQPSKTSLMQ